MIFRSDVISLQNIKSFVEAFAQSRKTPVNFVIYISPSVSLSLLPSVCLSVSSSARLSACKSVTTTRRISIKFDNWGLLKKPVNELQIWSKSNKYIGHFT